MEQVTLGEVYKVLLFVSGFIAVVIALIVYIKKALSKVIQNEIKPLSGEMKELSRKIDISQMDTAKDFITHFLSRAEAGAEPTEPELQCFYDNLRIYEEKGGNGFIHAWIDRLEDEGKLGHHICHSQNAHHN